MANSKIIHIDLQNIGNKEVTVSPPASKTVRTKNIARKQSKETGHQKKSRGRGRSSR